MMARSTGGPVNNRSTDTAPNGWLRRLDVVWKAIVAIVGFIVLIDVMRQWTGEKRTSPAEAIEQLAAQLKEQTNQNNRRDSAQRLMNSTLERAILQNSYSICILSKRPQGDCADILLGNASLRR